MWLLVIQVRLNYDFPLLDIKDKLLKLVEVNKSKQNIDGVNVNFLVLDKILRKMDIEGIDLVLRECLNQPRIDNFLKNLYVFFEDCRIFELVFVIISKHVLMFIYYLVLGFLEIATSNIVRYFVEDSTIVSWNCSQIHGFLSINF